MEAEALTTREQEIYKMLLAGSTPKEIGYKLKLAYGTVTTHQNKIYRKLGVHNISEFLLKYVSADDAKVQKKEKSRVVNFHSWGEFNDPCSIISLARTNEEINGKTEKCISIFGTLHHHIVENKNAAHAGAYGKPDKSSLETLYTMKSFSFKALGDGNAYFVNFRTNDTIHGCHYIYFFHTEKYKINTYTVKIPEDLTYETWSGESKFIQNDIIAIIFQPVHPGPFNLKFWDIRSYQN